MTRRRILIALSLLLVALLCFSRAVSNGVVAGDSAGFRSSSSAEAARRGVLLARVKVDDRALRAHGQGVREAWIEDARQVYYRWLFLRRDSLLHRPRLIVRLDSEECGPRLREADLGALGGSCSTAEIPVGQPFPDSIHLSAYDESCRALGFGTRNLLDIPAVQSLRTPDGRFPEARSELLRRGDRAVAALSWEPYHGALLLLSCAGDLIASRDLGAIDSIRAIDATPDAAPELIAYHNTGVGTGYLRNEATLVAIERDTLAVRWSGVVFEGNHPGPFARWTEETARVEISRPGRIARVGEIQPVAPSEDGSELVRTGPSRPFREIYDWNGRAYRRSP